MTQVLYANSTTSSDLMDDDDLIGSFKTPDELQAEQNQQAQGQIDNLVAAINALSLASMFVGAQERKQMLGALVPFAQSVPLDVQAIDRIIDTLTANQWDSSDAKFFLELCQLLPPTPTFTPFTFDELEAMPPKEWIIDQVLGKGDIGMIYGPPGCGKTFTVADMIICAIMGKPWARRFDIPRPLNVAYCAGEGISGLPARFIAATAHHDTTKEDKKNFTFFRNVPQFFTGDDIPEAIAITRFVNEWQKRLSEGKAQPLDILFVDTLNTATVAADENSAKDMGKVLSMCRWATQELGCAIVLIHHTNKTGSAERGSSALRGAMDCMIEIKRISDTGTKAIMSCEKLKDGEAWKPQTLDLVPVQDVDSVRVWWDEPSETSCSKGKEEQYRESMLEFLKRQPGKKIAAKTLAEVAGIGPTHANRILSRMVSDGACSSELMDSGKQSSNRNPLAYFISEVHS